MKNAIKPFSWLGIFFPTAVLFALWLASGPGAHAEGNAEVANAEQAFALVKNRIDAGSLQHYDVFIANEPLGGGSSIPSWGKNIKVPSYDDMAWFLFVDDQPDANWEHACRYFFVGVETGRVTVVPAKTPPDNWLEMKKIHSSGESP